MADDASDDFLNFLMATEDATERSVGDVIAADEAKRMSDEDFDDALWLALCGQISSANDLAPFPSGVRMYFATRMVECEIGNGGFGQLFDNGYDEYLEDAKAGYRVLGDEPSVALLERAEAMRDDFAMLDALDQEINGAPWNGVPWSDSARIAYVRDHRDEFRNTSS